jgi:hypothetical protein
MKLLLHYLKYDFLRWRVLVLLAWGLSALYAATFRGLYQGLKWPGFDWLETVGAVLAFCGVALCLLAGGSDSRVAGRTWLMTRPGKAGAFVTARSILILAGAVLPMVLAHTVVLIWLRFDGATVVIEAALAGALLGLAGAVCALWAAARPWWPAVLTGAAAAALCGFAVLHFFLPATLLPHDWFRVAPQHLMLGILAAAAIPAAVAGLRRPESRRAWKRRGAMMGFVPVLSAALLVPLQYYLRRHAPVEVSEADFAGAREWTVPLTERVVGMGSSFFQKSAEVVEWQFDLPMPDVGEDRMFLGGDFLSFSWRRDAAARWSPWQPFPAPSGISTAENRWWLRLRMSAGAMDLNNAEVRVRMIARMASECSVRLPLREGEIHTGDGWNFVVGPVEHGPGHLKWEGVSWTTSFRSRNFFPEVSLEAAGGELDRNSGWGMGSSGSFSRSLPFLMVKFREESFHNYTRSADDKDPPSPPDLSAMHVLVQPRGGAEEREYRVLHLTGVTLTWPRPEGQGPAVPWQEALPPNRPHPLYGAGSRRFLMRMPVGTKWRVIWITLPPATGSIVRVRGDGDGTGWFGLPHWFRSGCHCSWRQ